MRSLCVLLFAVPVKHCWSNEMYRRNMMKAVCGARMFCNYRLCVYIVSNCMVDSCCVRLGICNVYMQEWEWDWYVWILYAASLIDEHWAVIDMRSMHIRHPVDVWLKQYIFRYNGRIIADYNCCLTMRENAVQVGDGRLIAGFEIYMAVLANTANPLGRPIP